MSKIVCIRCYISLVILGWPPSVWAANLVGPSDIAWHKYGYVLFMGFWGASAALLQRFAKGQDITRWRLVVARDLVNATLAALLVFLVCEYQGTPWPLAAVFYTLAGYGGAQVMEVLYSRFFNTIKRQKPGVEDQP